ncbi:hypothetical protein [Longimicrobium terrae]|uniref:Ubiquitin-like domain-containing protein n=1 Tax=Longimicrobium terrae TaxID=1639882 RepID=A0A841H1R0_9BACT|nr:hypothetical protein [Longimicrobium terrae]MBB4637525.1 hypothetical protein [Longimicrobium terrae]MBB6071922.1 hypothetical protein [Longimicrobium terrae]NNC30469.1 hypothetical protein [Longimicrobium terrae]
MAGKGDEHGVVRVRVESTEGNLEHPFRVSQTVGELKRFVYDRLVQDKGNVPLSATYIQLGGKSVADSELIGGLATGGKNRGNEVDVVVSLGWPMSGGARR